MSRIKITCSEGDKKQLLYLFTYTDICPFYAPREDICEGNLDNCIKCIGKNIEFEIKED